MMKPIPKKIGEVKVEELGNNLLKLTSSSWAWNPLKNLWAALVEIRKIRIVTHFSLISAWVYYLIVVTK